MGLKSSVLYVKLNVLFEYKLERNTFWVITMVQFCVIGCKIVKYAFRDFFFQKCVFFYFCIFWWRHLNEFHFCLKITHIIENKLFYRINERNASILWSKLLMKNGILRKICCKKWFFWFLVAMVTGVGLKMIYNCLYLFFSHLIKTFE